MTNTSRNRAPELGRFSFGIGDRFGHQGAAQLAALIEARREGINVTPVWNKSNREHSLIGTRPEDTRAAADAAAAEKEWIHAYLLDADHVGLANVDKFIDACDFFTPDVADAIDKPADDSAISNLAERVLKIFGSAPELPGLGRKLDLHRELVEAAARKYLNAAIEAGKTYRHITEQRGAATFVVEVSMDETDSPQTPAELLVILTALSDEKIPVRTIAPRFSGRFNKGVDYVGNPAAFGREFEADVAVLALACANLGLPDYIKLSVHSGSDKFSIYEPIRKTLEKTGAGLHLKTAGTTWLEELIGLSLAGGDALEFVKEIWGAALVRREELSKPYATVIDIDPAGLPPVEEVAGWDGGRFAAALRHIPENPNFNPNLRQLLHVAFKLAAEAGQRYIALLEKHRDIIVREVTANLLERHIRKVFPRG